MGNNQDQTNILEAIISALRISAFICSKNLKKIQMMGDRVMGEN